MAPSYLSALILVASQVLPFIGINVGSDALTTTVQTVIAIVAGLVIMYRQIATNRSTVTGSRP